MLFVTTSFAKDYSIDGVTLKFLEVMRNRNIPFALNSRCNAEEHMKPILAPYPIFTRPKNLYNLVINPVCYLNHYDIDEKTIIWTLWDESIVPKHFVDEVNKGAICIVPSHHCMETFKASGVKIPIEVIPLGYDSQYHFQAVSSWRDRFESGIIFGAGGQVTSVRNDKKNLPKVISAFKKAFQDTDKYPDVSLKIRITKESRMDSLSDDPRIEIIKRDFSHKEMGDFHRNISCFVNLSQFEAFGKQQLEAMACGIPLITVNYSGITEYYKNDMGYTVGHKLVQAKSPPYVTGYWADANEDEVISQMRNVYKNRSEVYSRGQLAASRVESFEDFNWHHKFVDLIKRFCYL